MGTELKEVARAAVGSQPSGATLRDPVSRLIKDAGNGGSAVGMASAALG